MDGPQRGDLSVPDHVVRPEEEEEEEVVVDMSQGTLFVPALGVWDQYSLFVLHSKVKKVGVVWSLTREQVHYEALCRGEGSARQGLGSTQQCSTESCSSL